jgi:hypothetical protein
MELHVGDGIETECYWCLHCELVQLVPAAMRVPMGDDHWCITPGCDGGGVGIDIYPWGPDIDGMAPFRQGVRPGQRVPLFR